MAAAIQVLSAFLILLLTSSCLGARQAEIKDGPSPSPAGSEWDASFIGAACDKTYKKELCYESLSPYASDINSNPQKLCSCASRLALQGIRNISRALSDDKHPIGFPPSSSPEIEINTCREVLASAESWIQKAMKEGPEEGGYGARNRYNNAMIDVYECSFFNITQEVKATGEVALFLISNARDLCP